MLGRGRDGRHSGEVLVRQLGAGLYEAIAFWQEDKTAPELKIFRKLANISPIRKGLKSKQLSTIRISDSILQTVKAFLELHSSSNILGFLRFSEACMYASRGYIYYPLS